MLDKLMAKNLSNAISGSETEGTIMERPEYVCLFVLTYLTNRFA